MSVRLSARLFARRTLVPGLFMFAVVGTLVALPGVASAAPVLPAAPYPPPAPTASVSTTTPTVGSSLGVSYNGFRAFERVSVDIVPGFRHLGALRANPTGAGFGSVRIPGGLRGTQVLLLTGLGSGRVATVIINVLGPGQAQGGQAGPGAGGSPTPGSGGSSSAGGTGSNSAAGRAGEGSSGGISGSQSAAGSAGLASTGFSAFEYARIAGGLILAGGALALVGRKARRRGGKAKTA